MDEKLLGLIAEAHLFIRSGRARELRESTDLTLNDMAAAVGVTGATISRWECGERTPKGERAARYAKALLTLEKVAASREGRQVG